MFRLVSSVDPRDHVSIGRLACSMKYKLRTAVSGLLLCRRRSFHLVDKRNKTTIREHAWKRVVNELDSDSDKTLSGSSFCLPVVVVVV